MLTTYFRFRNFMAFLLDTEGTLLRNSSSQSPTPLRYLAETGHRTTSLDRQWTVLRQRKKSPKNIVTAFRTKSRTWPSKMLSNYSCTQASTQKEEQIRQNIIRIEELSQWTIAYEEEIAKHEIRWKNSELKRNVKIKLWSKNSRTALRSLIFWRTRVKNR